MRWEALPRLALAVGIAGCAGPAAKAGPPGAAADGGKRYLHLASLPADELREPPVYRNISHNPNVVEIHMTISETQLQLVPEGPKTNCFAFSDSSATLGARPGTPFLPGPAIEAFDGQTVIAHVHNRTRFPANVHWHGMIIQPEHDGGPYNFVEPGADHTYRWTNKAGFPMTGWYHAHPHSLTHVVVPRGMVGELRILPRQDPVPAAYGSMQLMLGDPELDASNQFAPDTEDERIQGREGNILTVNGQVHPQLTLRPNEIRRLRFLATGPARFWNLSIPGHPFVQIGTDGGLFKTPVKRDSIVLGVAERAEVLVQAPPVAGQRLTLFKLPFDRGQGLREPDPLPLMEIVTAGEPVTPPPIPTSLRDVPPIDLAGAHERKFVIGQTRFDGITHFTLNGKVYDPIRVDNVIPFGSREIWTIDNHQGNWDHPMHLHSIQFQVLDVNGVKPVEGLAWKDTVRVPRSGVARIAVDFADRTGYFMWHCHILQHEDDGLMSWNLIEPNAKAQQTGPLPPLEPPKLDKARLQLLGLSNAKFWCGPPPPQEGR